MIILSDEPKTLVLAAERLINLSANIRSQYSIDELAFRLNDFIRELRSAKVSGGFIGTSGFYIFYYLDEDGVEEIKVVLSVSDFYLYPDDSESQQFVMTDSSAPVYDESCPSEWLETDGAN